jgi:hypothetical protein
MSGVVLPLQYAFMAWCSVQKKKAHGQLYLYLTIMKNGKGLGKTAEVAFAL